MDGIDDWLHDKPVPVAKKATIPAKRLVYVFQGPVPTKRLLKESEPAPPMTIQDIYTYDLLLEKIQEAFRKDRTAPDAPTCAPAAPEDMYADMDDYELPKVEPGALFPDQPVQAAAEEPAAPAEPATDTDDYWAFLKDIKADKQTALDEDIEQFSDEGDDAVIKKKRKKPSAT